MNTATLIFVVSFVAFGADPTCVPPPAIVERLTAVCRYENGLGRNRLYQERFSYIQVEGRNYVRQNTVPEHYDPSLGPVWIFESNAEVVGPGANCSPGASWVD